MLIALVITLKIRIMESLESETITEEIVTFFTTQPVFPQVIDGTIDTKNFLDASRSVVELIGKNFHQHPLENIHVIML